ncbi:MULTISPECIES: molybdopterin molybdotransferase MoeA [Desulfovibrio]|uniref:Molybdopterin molybdenumtransferase n=1 Tax=Desulfovibrio desulfuricans TaxID=876 RepID=A0AA94HS61_DESDE|nr:MULTISPECIES: gephyrin-like molybdotransferase Glp [Desulfovibrio]ATD80609.1 molybdopterin molybdenumtransferase MoeA [Desulfovibrio sp. G11]SFW39271.1 molybdopterin molybdotransferase [Desulfovibrio desulfuricans]SPD36113.1 Molybdenum cofactor biosynthesis protein [Desulfovibrio sp. G11]
MKAFLTLQSVESVLEHIHQFPVLEYENVSLNNALGRRLAHDFCAPENLPGFNRSTMDGYAVRARDVFGAQEGSPALVECVGDCPMGAKPDLTLAEGQAARIATGGMLPEGADCVVMVEYSRPAGGKLVELTRSQAPGDNVIFHNDDASTGDRLLPAGHCLRPQDIGLLAAFGATGVAVRRKPRVAVLSTGDEIVSATETPPPGKIRDINAHSITALCCQAGGRASRAGLVRDNARELEAALAGLAAAHDIIVVSGGSSAGARDHTVEVFAALPQSEIITHGVALSPGKPFILARAGIDGRTVCLMGLPGHTVSALICARVFLVPLLHHLQGGTGTEIAACVPAVLSRSIASAQGRRDYLRVRLQPLPATSPSSSGATRGQALYTAEPITGASGLITGLAAADGLLVCPENREGFSMGDIVMVELFQ